MAGSIPGSRRSFWGHCFANFGMSWDVSGSGLGMFLDGFGMVWEKMSDEVENQKKGSVKPPGSSLRSFRIKNQGGKMKSERRDLFAEWVRTEHF